MGRFVGREGDQGVDRWVSVNPGMHGAGDDDVMGGGMSMIILIGYGTP